MARKAWRATVYGVTKSHTRLSNSHTHTHTHDGYVCHKFRSRLCGSGSGFLWFCHQYSGWRISFHDDWLPWCWLFAGILSSSLFGLLHGLLEWKGAWLPRVNNFKYRQQSKSILWSSLVSHTLQFPYCPVANQVSYIPFGRRLYKGVNSYMRGLLDWIVGWLQMAKGSFLCTVSRFLVWQNSLSYGAYILKKADHKLTQIRNCHIPLLSRERRIETNWVMRLGYFW